MNNQSKLHYDLTRKTADWLNNKVTNRGVKWMQEFTLTNGLRIDAVAYCSLMRGWYDKFMRTSIDINAMDRELKNCGNYYRPMLWQILADDDKDKEKEIREEWYEGKEEIYQRYNLPDNHFMFAFETKVTIEDFNNTFLYDNHSPSKKEPFANFHFLVVPESFNFNALPDFYGVLKRHGKGLSIRRMPKYYRIDELYFYKNAYNMLFRIDRMRWSDINNKF